MSAVGKSADQRLFVPTESHKFALIVGINDSSVSSYYRPALKHAEKDADDLAYILRQSECGFTASVPNLIGEKATTWNIKQGVIDLVSRRTKDDFLLFYFAGHAVPINNDIYFVTSDFQEDKVEVDPELYLSMRWLLKVLYQSTGAGRVLLILDCCYAGNIIEEKDDPFKIDLRKLLEDWETGFNGKALHNHLRLILTATGYNVKAQELDGHGLMTGLLLKALRGEVEDVLDKEGHVDIRVLHRYLQERMPAEQLPDLSGKFGPYNCILASYPLRSKHHHQTETPDLKKQVENGILSALLKLPIETQHSQPFDHSICRSASFSDLDNEKIAEFLKRQRTQQEDNFHPNISIQDQFISFGFLQESFPTFGVLLCFGQTPSRWVSGATTRCVEWGGGSDLDRMLDSREYQGSLLNQFELSLSFLKKRLRLRRVIRQVGREDQWEIPSAVLEEALANALVHREYANRTDCVRIELFDNRIEISSPGTLPPPMTEELLRVKHKSYPRNPQIAGIFYLQGNIEKFGTGIQRMQRYMKDAGLPEPELKLGEDKTFTVILYRPDQMPEGAVHSEDFGQLLTLGLESIATRQDRSLEDVIRELCLSMALESPIIIQSWRQGWIPNSPAQLMILADMCVQSGNMDQIWKRDFLQLARSGEDQVSKGELKDGEPSDEPDRRADDQFNILAEHTQSNTIGSSSTVNYNGLNAQDLQELFKTWGQADKEWLKDLSNMLKSTTDTPKGADDVKQTLFQSLSYEREEVTSENEIMAAISVRNELELPKTLDELSQWYDKLNSYEQCFAQAVTILYGAPLLDVADAANRLYHLIQQPQAKVQSTGKSALLQRSLTITRRINNVERIFWRVADMQAQQAFTLLMLRFIAEESAISYGGPRLSETMRQWAELLRKECSGKAARTLGVILYYQSADELWRTANAWVRSKRTRDWQLAALALSGAYEVDLLEEKGHANDIQRSPIFRLVNQWVERAQNARNPNAGYAAARTYGLLSRKVPDIALSGLESLLCFPESKASNNWESIAVTVWTESVSNYVSLAWSGQVRKVLAHLARYAEMLIFQYHRSQKVKDSNADHARCRLNLEAIFDIFLLIALYSSIANQEVATINYSLTEPLSDQPNVPDEQGRDVLLAGSLSQEEPFWRNQVITLLCAAIFAEREEEAFFFLHQWADVVLQSTAENKDALRAAFVDFMADLGRKENQWHKDLTDMGCDPLPAPRTFIYNLRQWHDKHQLQPIAILIQDVFIRLNEMSNNT